VALDVAALEYPIDESLGSTSALSHRHPGVSDLHVLYARSVLGVVELLLLGIGLCPPVPTPLEPALLGLDPDVGVGVAHLADHPPPRNRGPRYRQRIE
jgi:hypothetical protein